MRAHLDFMMERIDRIDAIDAHTHLDVAHLSARGLHDILLYHMVISDLYSAGCPDGARLSEDPTDEEIEYRITRALPYLPYVQNTSCFNMSRMILKDLYDWEEPVTASNWHVIHDIIRKRSGEAHGREIMAKARITKTNTELWRGRDGSCDDIFTYSLEWAFFTRAQWGRNDAALLELEHGWNHDAPCPPLPVTSTDEELRFKKKITSIGDVDAALDHYMERIPYDRIMTIASHISTDITYRPVTRAEMTAAIANRGNATDADRDVYANYIFTEFLHRFERTGIDMPLQFSMAAEPLPYESGSIMRSETPFELARIMAAHPDIHFNFHIANMAANQTFCTIARELPNLSLNGYWWHNFFPAFIPRILRERLDMVAVNKIVGYFSDAYCMDWSYIKSRIIRKWTARVLAERIDDGMYTRQTAVRIAEWLLRDSAAGIFHIDLTQ